MGGPKLLDKRTVNAEIATQKKNLIDSGLAMARKVDTIRDALQEEEKQLESFRSETIAKVRIEIDQHIAELDLLKEEIEDIRYQKVLAQIPLDKEWNDLKVQQGKLLSEKQTWSEKFDRLKERESQIEKIEIESEHEKNRIIDLRQKTSTSLQEADDILKQAREASADIRNKAQAVFFRTEVKEKELLYKEKELEDREYWVDKKTKLTEEKEIDLLQREKLLKDRYDTLERTISRLN